MTLYGNKYGFNPYLYQDQKPRRRTLAELAVEGVKSSGFSEVDCGVDFDAVERIEEGLDQYAYGDLSYDQFKGLVMRIKRGSTSETRDVIDAMIIAKHQNPIFTRRAATKSGTFAGSEFGPNRQEEFRSLDLKAQQPEGVAEGAGADLLARVIAQVRESREAKNG